MSGYMLLLPCLPTTIFPPRHFLPSTTSVRFGWSGPNPPYQRDRGHRRASPPPPAAKKGRQASPENNDREAAKIEKRIAKERPCRILFIRNVKVSETLDTLCYPFFRKCLFILRY